MRSIAATLAALALLLTGSPASAVTPAPTTLTAVLQEGRPDIIRAHLTFSSGRPIYRGKVTLYERQAGTGWRWVGVAYTDANGWAYLGEHPRWWTAYQWAFLRTHGAFIASYSNVLVDP